MENPYEPPQPRPDFSDRPAPAGKIAPGQRVRGLVGHVRVLGILMIVHGSLAALFGLTCVGLGVFMGIMLTIDPNFAPQDENDPPPLVMGAMVTIFGLCALVPGIMQIWAGIRVLRFQGRIFAIVSLFSGFATAMTCYCSITAIGLVVYGLIVMFDTSVKEAFELVEKGHKPDEVDRMFNPWTTR
jgi:hypothetical protein